MTTPVGAGNWQGRERVATRAVSELQLWPCAAIRAGKPTNLHTNEQHVEDLAYICPRRRTSLHVFARTATRAFESTKTPRRSNQACLWLRVSAGVSESSASGWWPPLAEA